jgi:pantoate--beta-alanine ligase
MRAAREACDEVVVSLFVNPAQFDEASDLAAYPRTEARDAAEAEALGVDVLFAPSAEEVYPDGFATSVRVDGLSDVLEGAERGPGHFAGVCTVVTKLFNVVAPDVAFFGQKDAQQVAVLRRMVADLDLPVALEIVPTVREPDGLALSSRNVRLGAAERERAIALSRALGAAEAAIGGGERDAARLREAAVAELNAHGVEPEYLALVDPDSFQPVHTVNGHVLVAVAARVGRTRLIDNALVQTDGGDPSRAPTTTKEF